MRKSNKIMLWTVENNFSDLAELVSRKYLWSKRNREYNNFWKILGEKDFNTIDNCKIHYLLTNSCVELPQVSDEELLECLPENARTKYEVCTIYFVKKGESTICLMQGSCYSGSRIRNRLMKSSNEETVSWKHVEYKNIAEYSLDSNFYYWLLSQKNNELKLNENEFKILEIEGFQSSENRRNSGEVPRDFNGSGSEIDKRIPFQSIVSGNGNLVSLHINLICNCISFDFTINSDYSAEIDFSKSGIFDGANPKKYEDNFFVLNLYSVIIPALRLMYRRAMKNGWLDQEPAFRKRTALKVIKQLAVQNNINSRELGSVLL